MHLGDPTGFQRARGSFERRPRRSHVVHQEHAPDPMQTPRRKRASHVPLPFAVRQIDLARGVLHAAEPPGQRRDSERLGHRPAKQDGMVITARATLSPVKRDGYHRIDLARQAPGLLRHDRAERGPELAPPVVLEAVDRFRYWTAVLEDCAWVTRPLDRSLARSTEEGRLIAWPVAASAARRRYQGQEPIEERAHALVSAPCRAELRVRSRRSRRLQPEGRRPDSRHSERARS